RPAGDGPGLASGLHRPSHTGARPDAPGSEGSLTSDDSRALLHRVRRAAPSDASVGALTSPSREIRVSLAALDSRPPGDPLHFTLLYFRWVTPGASTARTCSSCSSASRRLSKRRAPSPSTTGTTWSSSSSSSPAARYC